MKSIAFAAMLAGSVCGVATEAEAAGCIKGAVVGGVAGHYAGGHSILGAVGGCVVGHHLAAQKAARERAQAAQQNPPAQPAQPNNGGAYTRSSAPGQLADPTSGFPTTPAR